MDNILETVVNSKKIGIAGHVRPDGDCVGSCIALYNYLTTHCKGKEVTVYLEKIPDTFMFLKNIDKIKTTYDDNEIYDTFISLDCGSLDRLGPAERYFTEAKMNINIDHHISNTFFAKENHVLPDSSSTCEVLYGIFENEKIDEAVAEALYMGIAHDTGVFKHSNTTKHTMMVAGSLMEKGIPFSKLIDETFYQKTYVQNQVLGRCLLESILVLDGRCIVSTVSKKVIDFYGAKSEDLDGVIDQLRITKGVEAAVFAYEVDKDIYKVSMRSNGLVNVSKIATYFNGGGHIRAAGCTMMGNVYDVINNITHHIEAQLEYNRVHNDNSETNLES
ncbi:phosphoesterase RecJ-like protein [Mobilisporobacter senegalensis]|uniref:Phosphoesterase RecJ-like protein n=1 Tax=Mobilisporobacter senegalensis TaxID=1329262 RepID=A0A3N1XZY2_9FIRM|nr:bifunctional oligoribonuclease/PAP phosphatase NrnA [Mobilisporobacter senegalensis]ROR30822.1 phosphoesterase RecJ-like protein [Mobilisporobacter senegalensis]